MITRPTAQLTRWLPHQLRTIAFIAAMCIYSICALAATNPKAARFYEEALTRYEKKDMAGAIIQLKNALSIDKAMLPVHVLLGKALLAKGEVIAAEVAFDEALRLGVDMPKWLCHWRSRFWPKPRRHSCWKKRALPRLACRKASSRNCC